MALYVSLGLMGALTALLFVVVLMHISSRDRHREQAPIGPSTKSVPVQTATSDGLWSAHIGALHDAPDPVAQRDVPNWRLHAEAARVEEPGLYKTKSSSTSRGEHWDPYAESQSRANRAQAARRKPRPHRVPAAGEPPSDRARELDPYTLLGVSRVATLQEIERAYRRQVSSVHPDKFYHDPVGRQKAHEALKDLNAAVHVLRNRRPAALDDGP